MQIRGTVASGFESVQALYERHMRTMAEVNTQLCVYHEGERVVDLWASATNDASFSPDSLVNVFSSGKSLESLAIGSLVDRELLRYSDRIAMHWPEFASHGKSDITVADLMRHEGGLAAFDTSLPPEDLLPKHIKENRIGRVIERQTAKFREPPGSQREYHALTRGWIVNEVFRRVDPDGRTVGEYLREEIANPLDADVVIGVPETELGRISKLVPLGFLAHLVASLRPRFLGRRVKHGFFRLVGRILRFVPRARKAPAGGAPPALVGFKEIAFFNEPVIAMGETPSAGARCSARGLAKVAAMMAARGTWKGRTYLGPEAWSALHGEPTDADIGFVMTRFTQGGVNEFVEPNARSKGLSRAFNEGREGFYGWMGLGGSIFQWNPQQKIGFSFVPTSLHVLDVLNERGKVFQAEVLRCIEAKKQAG